VTHYTSIIGNSAALQRVLGLVRVVAPTEATVLIQGETGTGKELIVDGSGKTYVAAKAAINDAVLRRSFPRSCMEYSCHVLPLARVTSRFAAPSVSTFTAPSVPLAVMTILLPICPDLANLSQ
jgi:hypothetical protein